MVSKRYTYVVKFLNNTEMTSHVAEYEDLLDALMVAKDTDVNYRPMVSDEQFNEELIILLTAGQIKVKHKDVETIVMLTKRDTITDIETPVYSEVVVPFVANATGIIKNPNPNIPVARKSNSPVAKD